MATTSPTGRLFPLPDLVGVKAAQAIEQLRELGLTPVPLPSVVSDVAEAGFVLGLDPPPSAMVRPKTRITISVATHPDFDGRSDAAIEQPPAIPVQPPLGWPHSAPAGLAAPEPEFDPRDLDASTQTAAVPNSQSAPASAVSDAAFTESPFDGGSSAATPSDSAAPPFLDDFSASVPTPDEYAAQDEFDRIRAQEAAEFERQQTSAGGAGVPNFDDDQPVVQAELVDRERERAAEEEERRIARRRSARRYRRLTFKQKAIVGFVLLSTVLLVLAAASGHKHPLKHASLNHTTSKRSATPKARTHPRAPKKAHKPRKPRRTPIAKPKRVIVIRTRTRTRTRVVTVTVPTPTPGTSSAPSSSAPSTASSYSPPAQTPVTHTVATSAPTTTTPSSPKPASTRTSTDSSPSGTRGGGALQSPDGGIAPPKPTQP